MSRLKITRASLTLNHRRRLWRRLAVLTVGFASVGSVAAVTTVAGAAPGAAAAGKPVPQIVATSVGKAPRVASTTLRFAGLHFAAPHFYRRVIGDTYFNTVGRGGDIVATSDDSWGANGACATSGGDIVILHARGRKPGGLTVMTVNCMTSYGPRGGGRSWDGCSWKSGGITRIGRTIYLAVSRQLGQCSRGKQGRGLQLSFNASIIKSVDGGKTWTNPWGGHGRTGAAPPYSRRLNRYKAMFPGRSFSAPFFIQYGPGNSHAVDGGNKYLYAVSNDGYAYDGNYLRLARVPLNKVQRARAWRFYHGPVGGAGRFWTKRVAGATRVLRVTHGVSQPAIQYVPALKEYVLITFSYSHPGRIFPLRVKTPYTRFRIYTAHKPWGPWTKVYDHPGQRSLWCYSKPCHLTRHPGSSSSRHPGSTSLRVGRPDDWLGLYDPVLVQKFVFTRPLGNQAIFTSGDFKNASRYSRQNLYRLYVMPLDLSVIRVRTVAVSYGGTVGGTMDVE